MSGLGPDYLAVMRDALFQFCGEIRIFYTDHGNMPNQGSPADHEKAMSPCSELLVIAWCKAVQLIESGGEHVAAYVRTISEPIQPIACWTSARSMLEPCSLASWLLDQNIDTHTRVGRVFAMRYEGIEQHLKYSSVTGASDELLQGSKKRLDDIERHALSLGYPRIVNKNGKRIGIGQKMPSATEVIHDMLDEEKLYRLLSAVTHGHDWAIRELAFRPLLEGNLSPNTAKVGVSKFEKRVDVNKLALLGLTVAKAFARPVWDQCNYAGWDIERLIGVFDSTFDKLGLRLSKRFWSAPRN